MIKDKLFFYFIAAIMGIVFSFNKDKTYPLLIFIVFLIVVIYKKEYKVFPIAIIICSLFIIYRPASKPLIDHELTTYTGTISESKKSYSILKSQGNYFLIYGEFKKNDKLKFNAIATEIEGEGNFNIFDFSDYLRNKRVHYELKVSGEITYLAYGKDTINKFINAVTINLPSNISNLIKLLIFNQSNDDISMIRTSLVDLSVISLFVISGFHIIFLHRFLVFILGHLFTKENSELIATILLIPYLQLLAWSLSATRAFIALVLRKTRFNSFDIIAISGFIFIIIEPGVIFSIAFIMTFLLITAINVCPTFIKRKKILLSFICFLTTFPIIININYQISPIALFGNVLLAPLIPFLIIVCLVTLFIPIVGKFSDVIAKYFFEVINKVNGYNRLFIFPKFDLFSGLIYYSLLILFLISLHYKKKKTILFNFMALINAIVCFYYKPYIIPSESVTFIDVGQGDCTLIRTKNSKEVILIDTGGVTYKDQAVTTLIPYFKSLGLKKIDKIIITHQHYDHYGNLNSLLQNYHVKEVISDLSVFKIKVGDKYLYNLNRSCASADINDCSLVLYGDIAGYKMLFMGDASKIVEKNIMSNYEHIPADIIKVGHHGSLTASSEEFLQYVQPKLAIISVAKYNWYGHPHPAVLERLKANNIKYLLTSVSGAIKITKILNYSYINTKK